MLGTKMANSPESQGGTEFMVARIYGEGMFLRQFRFVWRWVTAQPFQIQAADAENACTF